MKDIPTEIDITIDSDPSPPHADHRVVTPEGVTLYFPSAQIGPRLAAIVLDLLFLFLPIVIFVTLALLAEKADWDEDPFIFVVVVILSLFRTFYFLITEVVWRGMTPGKKILSLRVIDRLGGPLTMQALMARNLSREVELFLPLQYFFVALFQIDDWGGIDLVLNAATLVWMVSFAVFPLFNNDRLRLGDLIAGTMVVRQPIQHLLPDIALASDEELYSFNRAQLEAYGIYELEHLAAALRAREESRAEFLPEIATKIATKIDWSDPIPPEQAEPFLLAYYRALRSHLEQNLLFGKRRLSKYDN